MHDRRPAFIVQTSGVADVMATVKFSRKHDLLLAVRGGGHSVPGYATCNDSAVIDLERMKGIRVDPERRTARAEGAVHGVTSITRPMHLVLRRQAALYPRQALLVSLSGEGLAI